ncbi:site-specific integrase [bacterium]|nr:site-specific integrase [bacterium]
MHIRLPDGTLIRERRVAPVSSKTAAVRWGQALEREVLERALTGAALERNRKKAVPTLAEFAPRWLDEYCRAERQKASGITRKESVLRVHLLPALGGKRLDEITDSDVQRLKVDLGERAASTVNNTLTVLRRLLQVAIEWNVIDVMPCRIRLLPRTKNEAQFWDFDEYERLIEKAAVVSPSAHMLVLLGGSAGLRLGEMIALRWTDVDLDRRRLTVNQNDWRGNVSTPKGGRAGVVDLCEQLHAALLGHQVHTRLLSPDGRVLCLPDGSPLTEKRVRVFVERAEDLATLPHRGVHCLRHTFGAHLAMKGASPKAIQELMRHADLAMTGRYTHLSPAARESAVRLLDRAAG